MQHWKMWFLLQDLCSHVSTSSTSRHADQYQLDLEKGNPNESDSAGRANRMNEWSLFLVFLELVVTKFQQINLIRV